MDSPTIYRYIFMLCVFVCMCGGEEGVTGRGKVGYGWVQIGGEGEDRHG